MNPLTISKSENTDARMTGDSQRHATVAINAESQRESSTQQCQNGVCMVTWKPTKPQAA